VLIFSMPRKLPKDPVLNARDAARSRDKRRRLAREVAGGKCLLCGYNRCSAALEFHHIDPATKIFTIGSSGRGLKTVLEEIKKCVLLCSNCHREVEVGITKLPL